MKKLLFILNMLFLFLIVVVYDVKAEIKAQPVNIKSDEKIDVSELPKVEEIRKPREIKLAELAKNRSVFMEIDTNPILKNNYKNNPRVKVKGIYVSMHTISSQKQVDRLIRLANETDINTFVIDVKADWGTLLWKMPELTKKHNIDSDKYSVLKNIKPFMEKLKKNNIYAIARIVTFKDEIYAKKFADRTIYDTRTKAPYMTDKSTWGSPYDKDFQKYNIDVAVAAAKAGFNEVQFDYVRFPASNGGKIDKFLDYRNPEKISKAVAIQEFLKKAKQELNSYEVYISADIFGQVGSSPDDMGLGQYWEAISNAVDYICPMVYPSHYGPGVYGVAIPDTDPYNVVLQSSKDSMARNLNIETPAVIRTWIQDFTAVWVSGYRRYNTEEINLQIKALNDLGLEEYMLWNASNRYSFEKDLAPIPTLEKNYDKKVIASKSAVAIKKNNEVIENVLVSE
ncbi:MAG: putative glycoside hydrolase [Fusobacteriaceae bacterium]